MATDVPDAGVRAGELLTHVIGVAAVVVEDDAVELGRVGVGAEVRGRGYGAAGEGDYGGDFGYAEALADDFGGDETGRAGDDELHRLTSCSYVALSRFIEGLGYYLELIH